IPEARIAPAVVHLDHASTEESGGQEHHDLEIPPVAEPGEVGLELLPRRLLPKILSAADVGEHLLERRCLCVDRVGARLTADEPEAIGPVVEDLWQPGEAVG